MTKTVDISTVVKDSVEDFSSWEQNHDFDYHRVESAVVDYINASIDYTELDKHIDQGEALEIEGWNKLFQSFDIEQDSSASNAAKKHINAYIKARS